jgi:hypothetical protein
MNPIRTIGRLACILAGLASALLAFSTLSPAAFAYRLPPSGGSRARPTAQAPLHTIVTGGMPGWQITLIAAGTALLTATLAVLADRALTARRHAAASPASTIS